ncbi:hypothetical protein [Brevibacterium sp. FME37]|uniref:hypothetical protein n=1 Tax=Brevibacterium sp. FME37 TaxID=2742607 RepID=UPI001868D5AB|nr:hypothetical protein [Brevibacterium sp. FME37]
MTTYTTSKAAELARRLEEQEAENQRQLEAIRAEQAAHDKALDDALTTSGRARVALVEELLEQFGIDTVELEQRRNKRTGEVILDRKTGKPRTVDPDPDETMRMQRLKAAIDTAVKASKPITPPVPTAVPGKVGSSVEATSKAS